MVLIRMKPDPEPGGGGAKKPGIPADDQDFLDVATLTSTKWTATAAITLLWITEAAYAALVNNFKTFLNTRVTTGATRPQQTQILADLDTEINKNEEDVKAYIAAKYGAGSATSYYNQFGITHQNKGWSLPADHNDRSDALALMVAAIATHGFGANQFGTLYWTDIKARFDNALALANSIDGTVSSSVGDKNIYKVQIRKVMSSLRFVLRGNYPDNYAQVWRDWGWQKEDY